MYGHAVGDRVYHWVMKGRLALALVSVRARNCPHKVCGRAGRCLARFKPGSNYNQPMGSCPIMSAAEWRAVSFGMRGGLILLQPVFEALQEEMAKEEPDLSELSREERWARANSPGAIAGREAARRRYLAGPGPEYWRQLWQEPRDGILTSRPRDPVATDALFIAFQAERGCRCAVEKRIGECADECEWVGPAGAAARGTPHPSDPRPPSAAKEKGGALITLL